MFKNLSNYVIFVSLHILSIIKNDNIYQGGDVISFINDFFSNFQFFIIRYKKFFLTIINFLNIVKREKKYINSTNSVSFFKYRFIFICTRFFIL